MESMQGSGQTSERMDLLANTLNIISRPGLRRAFLADPYGTLREHGAGDLPEELVDLLADMTYEELSVVARLCNPEHGFEIGTTRRGVFRFL